jgi:NAD(P)-dependent dehydrogenase (short-subunit alcohol dehydrogenase family)
MNQDTTDSQRFSNKVVIVTGAASGMGRASALRFGREGTRVWCADVNAEGVTETASMITAAGICRSGRHRQYGVLRRLQ